MISPFSLVQNAAGNPDPWLVKHQQFPEVRPTPGASQKANVPCPRRETQMRDYTTKKGTSPSMDNT